MGTMVVVNGQGGEWDRGLLRFNFRLTDFRKLGLGVLLIFFFRILFPFFLTYINACFSFFFVLRFLQRSKWSIYPANEGRVRPARRPKHDYVVRSIFWMWMTVDLLSFLAPPFRCRFELRNIYITFITIKVEG